MLANNLSSDFSTTSLWQVCLERIQEKISPATFQTWFATTNLFLDENARACVQVPNQFFADFIEEHFSAVILEALTESGINFSTLLFEPVTRDWKVIEPIAEELTKAKDSKIPQAVTVRENGNFHPNYTFESFIVGDSNRMAHAAAMAVAEAPGKTSFNPLIIYGGTGLGKTHLLQAIGHFAQTEGTADNVVYMTSEEFTNQYISFVINKKDSSSFYKKFNDVDLLLIDDIQFFSGKPGTQKEFYRIFDRLLREDKQIVLSSDRSPEKIPDMMEHIINRFKGGLNTDIQPPNLETRMAILRKKAETDGLTLPDEVIQYIASQITSNVRELEGTLIKLIASSSFTGADITLEVTRELCGDAINSKEERITVQFIKEITAQIFDISVNQLSAHTRKKEVSLPRSVAMYLSKKWTRQSLRSIGLEFGGRDYSTVIHAAKKIEAELNNDQVIELKRKVESIEKLLRESEV
ncbi:MAG: chromosomal replication initiator protein DnaA [Chitinispirillales bacterium]|jgi:chromosomal replication initiator protein|nr:chromosomal replication initiator protein DnaA [Chitinispirillales bacterium]